MFQFRSAFASPVRVTENGFDPSRVVGVHADTKGSRNTVPRAASDRRARCCLQVRVHGGVRRQGVLVLDEIAEVAFVTDQRFEADGLGDLQFADLLEPISRSILPGRAADFVQHLARGDQLVSIMS